MKIYDIAKYLIKEYPECCLAYNGIGEESDWEYYDRPLVEDCLSEFDKMLGLCGCGNPEYTHMVIRERLEAIYEYDFKDGKRNYNYDKESYDKKWNRIDNILGIERLNTRDNKAYYGMIQFMMYELDSCGFLEHGSSIGGAWITDLGIMYLEVLKMAQKYEEEE